MFGFTWYQSKQYEKQMEAQAQLDSIAFVEQMAAMALDSAKRAEGIVTDGEKWDKSLKDDNSFIAHKLYDNDSIRGLGYTSTYFNEIIKRFFFFYGLPMSNGTKQAQQSVEEVTSNYSASSVYCKQMLECMKDFVDDFNTLYNESMTVDFSESWLESMNAVRNLDNDGDIDFSQLKKESDSNVDTEE